jgi:hypothetical protein
MRTDAVIQDPRSSFVSVTFLVAHRVTFRYVPDALLPTRLGKALIKLRQQSMATVSLAKGLRTLKP